MSTIHESVERLSARLPELAWKLSSRYSLINHKLLPRGLFLEPLEMTPQSCIDEIYADLKRVRDHKNERSACYLAERISQKINVLIRLCQKPVEIKPGTQSHVFSIQTISTRQQWLDALHDDIVRLDVQYLALTTTLNNLQNGGSIQAILSVQAEVGEVERRLTLARETLARATL